MVPSKDRLGVIRVPFNILLSCLHSLAKSIGLIIEFDDVRMMSEVD